MKSFQFVTAVHGDELMPVFALGSVGIRQLIANPKALSINKRYVDTDMNSSFGKSGSSYEITRAREVLGLIPSKSLVIDLHTFKTKSPPFVIIVDKKMLALARKTGIKRVVFMKHNVKAGGALINHRYGISVEVGQHKDWRSFETTLSVVDSLRQNQTHDVELYEVYDVIKKAGKYSNFQLYRKKFYPVLSSKNYHGFYGLKARKLNQEDI